MPSAAVYFAFGIRHGLRDLAVNIRWNYFLCSAIKVERGKKEIQKSRGVTFLCSHWPRWKGDFSNLTENLNSEFVLVLLKCMQCAFQEIEYLWDENAGDSEKTPVFWANTITLYQKQSKDVAILTRVEAVVHFRYRACTRVQQWRLQMTLFWRNLAFVTTVVAHCFPNILPGTESLLALLVLLLHWEKTIWTDNFARNVTNTYFCFLN